PSKYIHIGGDECPKDRWQECSKCQRRIRREGLADEHALQSYFITRIEKYLNDHGRQIVGWDEILEGGLAPGATVQSWRGVDGGIAAAKSGHEVIMSPNGFTYFNADIANTDLRKAYSFEPVPATLTSQEASYVIGGEANMWSEYAPEELVDGKLFPRILALAEVLWTTGQNKKYEHFYERVQNHYQRLDYLGVNYGPESKALSLYSTYNLDDK
ncbi:MAG: family 20 glycosylhydrolase, partial [bacterium]|nr:family 20 glycosylhydrolase [bacterium]